MGNGILIWAELTRDKFLHTVVFELASKAMELSEKLYNIDISALVFLPANLIENYKEVFRLNGFDKVFYVENDKFSEYKSDVYSYAAIEAVKTISPKIMLIGATNQGRDIAPSISTALHTGLTADCTALDIIDNDKLAATRPTFGGQLMATILSKTEPQMATVRPKVFMPIKNHVEKNTEFIKLDIDVSNFNSAIEILEFKNKVCAELNNLDSADVIVAGGRGIKSVEGFKLIKNFADKIGGVAAASRAAVEMGIAPIECQVGQTGKTVNPKLYIACGISGALQHTVGIGSSAKIIAINNDKNAPIFEIADYGYIGDIFDVIPAILQNF